MIIEKHTGRPYVLEINTQAAYGAAMFPTFGQPRNVGEEVWKLRCAATAPERQTTPEVAGFTTGPASIIGEMPRESKAGHVEFADLFEQSLRRQGHRIERENHRVLRVYGPEDSDTHGRWVTRTGLTAADRYVVRTVMRNHEWVCGLLHAAEIPRPRTRILTSTRQLERFVNGRVGAVTLTPVSARWGGSDSYHITAQQALDITALPGRMRAQTRPRGHRLRVLATRDTASVVTTVNGARSVEQGHCDTGGRLAVEAVRAVPELQWAAVDLIVRPSRMAEGRPNGVIVEGLTQEPVYTAEDRIIAGDFDAFCRNLIHESNQPLPALGHQSSTTSRSVRDEPQLSESVEE